MARRSSRPLAAKDDLDLIPPEERRARRLRRLFFLAIPAVAALAAALYFALPAAGGAIKAWQSRRLAHQAFAMIDQEMAERSWAMGELFSMADCAAAPALGYCRMIYPFTRFKNVVGYMNRLAERPSFQRVLKEAEPYLKAFKK